jgi:hypothetical protein
MTAAAHIPTDGWDQLDLTESESWEWSAPPIEVKAGALVWQAPRNFLRHFEAVWAKCYARRPRNPVRESLGVTEGGAPFPRRSGDGSRVVGELKGRRGCRQLLLGLSVDE